MRTWKSWILCPSCKFLNRMEGHGEKPDPVRALCRQCDSLMTSSP